MNVQYLIIHCSDSDFPHHDNIETIKKWHTKERGWSDIGYHFVITKDGELHFGRPIWRNGAHARGYNSVAIGICLTGRHKFTQQQFDMLKEVCLELCEQKGIPLHNIMPHSAVTKGKTCPNFDLYKLKESWEICDNEKLN